MISCKDVAKYFLTITDSESGDLISNLKLQKLAYYAQGFHLAIYGEPLFSEKIEAWPHGPVVPELYNIYSQYGRGAIDVSVDYDASVYSEDVIELLKDIHDVYSQFSAWKLRDMTHEEPPWKSADCNAEISHEAMKEYFKTLLLDQ